MQELMLVGLKFHNYHVLIQQFFPVDIHDMFPTSVRGAISRLFCSSMPFARK